MYKKKCWRVNDRNIFFFYIEYIYYNQEIEKMRVNPLMVIA